MSTSNPTQAGQFAEHAISYHHFTLAVKWFSIHLAALVVFLTLWFATGAGFVGGLIAGLAVFGLGVFAMRHGLARSSEPEVVAEPARPVQPTSIEPQVIVTAVVVESSAASPGVSEVEAVSLIIAEETNNT